MPRDSSDLQRLLRFYLACAEEEDLRSLTLRRSQHHRSFVTPWADREPLLDTQAPEVEFEVHREPDRRFLTRGAAQAGEPERFFYGYPVYLDDRDQLAPLFVLEVEINPREGNSFALRPLDPKAIQLNHHLFRQRHVQPEELRAIQDDLEGAYGSFRARLARALHLLGDDPASIDPSSLQPFEVAARSRETWVNCPILFRSERSGYTTHLRRELEAFARYDRLLEAAPSTALAPFLRLRSSVVGGTGSPRASLLQVLPLNEQQESAARAGLEKVLTVITGPPGTGKSQVVVDLLASCALSKKSVLFASKNNKAVDVVRDRLRALLGEKQDWTLRLGSRVHMEACRDEMLERLAALPEDPPEVNQGADGQLLRLDEKISGLRAEIEALRKAQADLEAAKNQARQARLLVPESWVRFADEISPNQQVGTWLRRSRDEALALGGKKRLGLWLWILRLFMGHALRERIVSRVKQASRGLPETLWQMISAELSRDSDYLTVAEACEELLGLHVWVTAQYQEKEAANRLLGLRETMSIEQDLEKAKKSKAAISTDLLRASWMGRILSERETLHTSLRKYFELSDRIRSTRGGRAWYAVFREFVSITQKLSSLLPIWVVTNLSARRALALESALFDLVIIDEASQCDIASALPLLFRAKRAVIIGDPRQLRHISTIPGDREAEIAEAVGATDLLADWSYSSNSIYDLAEQVSSRGAAPKVLLREHYRSHPDVIGFSNRTFYGGNLVIRTPLALLSDRAGPGELGVFWHDTPGEVPSTGRSACNEAEVRGVLALLRQWHDRGLFARDLSVGVVTPFRLQMQRIEDAIRAEPWWEEVEGNLRVGTVHRYQGDECDIMIFSPVVSAGIADFLAKWVAETDQLLNVAITRTRCALHVVGDLGACRSAGGFLGPFAESALSQGFNETRRPQYESPTEERLAEILFDLGLWHRSQYPEGQDRLDFMVVSPLGTTYDVEVDGRGHWSADQIDQDRARDARLADRGYRVIRIPARNIELRPDLVRQQLARLT